MRNLLFPLLMLVTLILVGCSTVQTQHVLLEGATYSPVTPDHKVVILSDPPQKPFHRIAKLQAKAEEPATQEELTEGLLEEARKVGADAVIEVEMGEQSWNYSLPIIGPGGGVTGGTMNTATMAILTGIAIKYK